MSSIQTAEESSSQPSSRPVLEVDEVALCDLGTARREYNSTTDFNSRPVTERERRAIEAKRRALQPGTAEYKLVNDPNRATKVAAWGAYQAEADEDNDNLDNLDGGIGWRRNREVGVQAGRGGLSGGGPGRRGGASNSTNALSQSPGMLLDSSNRFASLRQPLPPRPAPPPQARPRVIQDASAPFVRTERSPFRPLHELQNPVPAPAMQMGHGFGEMAKRLEPRQRTQRSQNVRPGTGRPLHERITYPSHPLATTMEGFGSRRATSATAVNVKPEDIAKNKSKWATSQALYAPPAAKTMHGNNLTTASPAARLAAMSPPASPTKHIQQAGQQPPVPISRVGRPIAAAIHSSLTRSSSVVSTATRVESSHDSKRPAVRPAALAKPSDWLKTRDAKLGPVTTTPGNEEGPMVEQPTTTGNAVQSNSAAAANDQGQPVATAITPNGNKEIEDGEIGETEHTAQYRVDQNVKLNIPGKAVAKIERFDKKTLNSLLRAGVLARAKAKSAQAPSAQAGSSITTTHPSGDAQGQNESLTPSSTRTAMNRPMADTTTDEGATQEVQAPKPIEEDLIDLDYQDVTQQTQNVPSVYTELQDLMFSPDLPSGAPSSVYQDRMPTSMVQDVQAQVQQGPVPTLSHLTMQVQAQQAPMPLAPARVSTPQVLQDLAPAPKPQESLFGPAATGMKASRWAT